jgi:ATP-dependent protease Clp ATPase subunit
VVGQNYAKKVLSVAVYNHYKRIFHNMPTNGSTSGRSSILNDGSNIVETHSTGIFNHKGMQNMIIN